MMHIDVKIVHYYNDKPSLCTLLAPDHKLHDKSCNWMMQFNFSSNVANSYKELLPGLHSTKTIRYHSSSEDCSLSQHIPLSELSTVVHSCPQLSKLSVLQVYSSPIFHCNFPNRPGRCGRKKNGCQLKHKGDVRQFASCQQKCPRRYPWVNNLNGD